MKWLSSFAAAILVLAVATWMFAPAGAPRYEHGPPVLRPSFWQQMANPGPLSDGHAFLETRCAECHTAVIGADPIKCILCHANDDTLLQRQPTAFHADIRECADCHRGHRGDSLVGSAMDHAALARIGLRQLRASTDPDNEGRQVADLLSRWMQVTDSDRAARAPEEAILRCTTCHGNENRHFGLFGGECAQCHGTSSWTIRAFRHPSPASMDCAQCHQAPPSHYMEHFRMLSQRVADAKHARVDQCYICHQTTAWPDIKRVGLYKHH